MNVPNFKLYDFVIRSCILYSFCAILSCQLEKVNTSSTDNLYALLASRKPARKIKFDDTELEGEISAGQNQCKCKQSSCLKM